MEPSAFTHDGQDGYPTERRESHWQPALRPDASKPIEETSTKSRSNLLTASAPLHDNQTTTATKMEVQRSPLEMNSQELPSDDDDERLDPAWGIRRTDSAHILNAARRSSSFPRFIPEDPPALSNAPSSVEPPVLSTIPSQLEDLLNGNGEEEARYESTILAEDSEDILMGQAEQTKYDTGVGGIQNETMSDRYQEGLPLIDSQQQPTQLNNIIPTDSFTEHVFDVGTHDEEASFFTRAQQSQQDVEVPQALDRKTTSDVLDSIHIERVEKSDSPTVSDTESELNLSAQEPVVNTFPTSMSVNSPNLDAFAQHPLADDLFTSSAPAQQGAFEEFQTVPYLESSSLVKIALEDQLDAFAQEPSADDIFLSGISQSQKPPDDTDAKWAAVLDDDEFLVEDADDLLPDSEPGSPSSFIASLNEDTADLGLRSDRQPDLLAARLGQPVSDRNVSNPLAPHQPSTSDMTQLSQKAPKNIGFSQSGPTLMSSFQSQSERPTLTSRAESFADQAKGGYKSPYDLPIDLAKPKKRPQPQRVTSVTTKGMPPPPPRTSSISSDRPQALPFTPTSQTFPSTIASPMVVSPPGARVSSSGAAQPAKNRNASSSSFFEELPITSRPRPAPGSGRYTPSQNVSTPLPQLPLQSPPRQRMPSASSLQPSPPNTADPVAQYQLQPPERLDPYANVALQPQSIVPPIPSSRYSPATAAPLGVPRPTPSPRYSPAPPSQPPTTSNRYASQPAGLQPSATAPATSAKYASQPASAPPSANPALQFLPRTSSPLAYQRPAPNEQVNNSMPPPAVPRSAGIPSSSSFVSSPPKKTAPAVPSSLNNTPIFSPQASSENSTQMNFQPPKRSQTQSPSRQSGSRAAFPIPPENVLDRPASAYSNLSPVMTTAKLAPFVAAPQTSLARTASTGLEFIMPNDNTRDDSLERWKGAPIFRFGFGGNVITCFPQHTPRYSSSLSRPQLKVTAGEVLVRKARDVMPLAEHISSFPGPLRGKSKKKDVLAWLTTSITRLESESPSFLGVAQTLPDPRTCHEEKVLLWKVVKVLVEYDGVLETNTEALKAVNTILAPEVHAIDESTASQHRSDTETSAIYRPSGTTVRLDSTDPLAVETLRKHLMKGKRDDAVWHAVDNRLWSHALLISSTMDRSIWKQVVQEFVRQEVKTIGNNTESLATVYEVFGGNVDDSVDQLVPPSARAGLQMVSRVDSTGPTRNALDGLGRWKETLVLVLNNRSMDDQKALMALAKLLSDYGRIEAAHICLLFTRGPMFPSLFGAVDDPQSSITLLGADRRFPAVQKEEGAMLLTEVYEFATCTLGSAATAVPMPYLASYKLQRAKQLSDHGLKNEAQAYCEAIAASIGTKTKVSPYYHPVLLTELEELSNRLKQVPVQSSSWITKPSIEKVSGSIFSKFTNFVAGDDSDAESKGSGKDTAADVGPFANVSGSPTLSRSGSQTDLYGNFPVMTPVMPTTAGSRYAPNGMASARSSSEFGRGRPSIDSQRSPPSTSYGHEPRQSLYAPMMQNHSPARAASAYNPHGASPGQQFGTSPSLNSYQATPPQASYMPTNVQHHASGGLPDQRSDAYMPTLSQEQQSPYMPVQAAETERPAYGGYMPTPQPTTEIEAEQSGADSQAAPTYDATQSYGYEPPADTGYVPYQPDHDSDDDSKKQKPKKKSFMDDNDEFSNVTVNNQPSHPAPSTDDAAARRKAADEATNAAFLAAAAEDERRAKEQAAAKKSGSWFGGWLGAKKGGSDSLDSSPSGGGGGGGDSKVHRAKLGESKMKLYYDEKLKKWVNPDDPNSGKAKAGAPPPPRTGGTPAPTPGGSMLPPRSATASASPMPISSASRSSTPASMAGDIGNSAPPSVSTAGSGLANGAAAVPLPPSGAGTPIPGAGPPRIPTSASTTSIDDLLGPPVGGTRGKGAKGGKKKAGRYVDVMAQS